MRGGDREQIGEAEMTTVSAMISGLRASSKQSQEGTPDQIGLNINGVDMIATNTRRATWKEAQNRACRVEKNTTGIEEVFTKLQKWLGETKGKPGPVAKASNPTASTQIAKAGHPKASSPTASTQIAKACSPKEPIPTASIQIAKACSPTAASIPTASSPTAFTAPFSMQDLAKAIAGEMQKKPLAIEDRRDNMEDVKTMAMNEFMRTNREWLEEQAIATLLKDESFVNSKNVVRRAANMMMTEQPERVEMAAAKRYAKDNEDDEDFQAEAALAFAEKCKDENWFETKCAEEWLTENSLTDDMMKEAKKQWADENEDRLIKELLEEKADDDDFLDRCAEKHAQDSLLDDDEEFQEKVMKAYIKMNEAELHCKATNKRKKR